MSNQGFAVTKYAVLQNAAKADGDGTILGASGYTGVGLQITGTFSATINFRYTINGTTWLSIQGSSPASGAIATTATEAGGWWIPLPACLFFKAEISSYVSGSVTVVAVATTVMPGTTLADIDIQGIAGISTAANQTAVQANAGSDATKVIAVQGVTSGKPVDTSLPVLVGSDNFTRPDDTTAYASGDLVANNTTAGSVVPMTFTVVRAAAGGGSIRRVRIRKSGTSVTNASFRAHLYKTAPTPSNGDNGAWLTDNVANYLGSFDVTMDKAFTDGASGSGAPSIGSEINFVLASGTTIKGLIEARAAYTPVAQEVFTVDVECLPT